MKAAIWSTLLFFSIMLWTQVSKPDQPSASVRGQVTVRGCIAIFHGVYALMQQDPGNLYQLEQTD